MGVGLSSRELVTTNIFKLEYLELLTLLMNKKCTCMITAEKERIKRLQELVIAENNRFVKARRHGV